MFVIHSIYLISISMIKYSIILDIMKHNYVIEKTQKGARAMKLRYFLATTLWWRVIEFPWPNRFTLLRWSTALMYYKSFIFALIRTLKSNITGIMNGEGLDFDETGKFSIKYLCHFTWIVNLFDRKHCYFLLFDCTLFRNAWKKTWFLKLCFVSFLNVCTCINYSILWYTTSLTFVWILRKL